MVATPANRVRQILSEREREQQPEGARADAAPAAVAGAEGADITPSVPAQQPGTPDPFPQPQRTVIGGQTPRMPVRIDVTDQLNRIERFTVPSLSVVGGVLGAPEGPPGIAIGGALGAAAGAALAENIRDIGRRVGVQGLKPAATLVERFDNVINEAVLDMGFSAGAKVFSQVLRGGKQAVIRGLRADPKSLDLARIAREEFDINPNIANVSRSRIVEFFPRVLGRFPILADPLRRSALERGEEVLRGRDRLFLRLGPSVNMADLGVNMNRSADAGFRLFRRRINRLYAEAFDAARASGATLDTAAIKEARREVLDELKRRKGGLDKSSPVVKFLNKRTATGIQKMAGRVSMERLDGFLEDLDEAMRIARKDGFSVRALARVKQAAEEALGTLDNPDALAKFQEADQTFSRIMTEVFETPTAQKFGTIAKDRFRVGLSRAGSRNADEAFRIAFNAESPQAMTDLRKLIGPRRFRQTMGSFVRQAFRKGLTESGEQAFREGNLAIDFNSIRQELGLLDRQGTRFKALKSALAGTPLDMKTLEQFIDAGELALRNAPPDVNQFIARRATLGGFRSIINAIVPTAVFSGGGGAAAGTGGVFAGAGVLLFLRRFSTFISDPRKLKRLTDAVLDDDLAFQRRRAILVGLGNALDKSGEDETPRTGLEQAQEAFTGPGVL